MLRTARALEHLPRIAQAFREGQLGWGKIRELTRVVAPETEAAWLDFALTSSTAEVQRQVSMSPKDWKKGLVAALSRGQQGQLTLSCEPAGGQKLPGSAPPASADRPVTPAGATTEQSLWAATEPSLPAGAATDRPLSPAEAASDRPLSPAGAATEQSQAADGGGKPQSITAGGAVSELPLAAGTTASGRLPSPAQAATEPPVPQAGAPVTPSTGSSSSSAPAGELLPESTAPISEPTGPDRAGPAPLPLPLPGPKRVRVVLNFTAEEYAEYEQCEAFIRGQLRKRARRERVILEMARRSVAGATERTRDRYRVIIHTDPRVETAWYETDRGALAVPAEALDEGLREGTVTFVPEVRTETEQSSPGNSKGILKGTLNLLYARAGGKCEVCGARGLLQVHHLKARSRGGGHELANLQLRCADCHDLAHDDDFKKDPTWRQARGRRRARSGRKVPPEDEPDQSAPRCRPGGLQG